MDGPASDAEVDGPSTIEDFGFNNWPLRLKVEDDIRPKVVAADCVGSADTGVGMEVKAGVVDEITTVGDDLLLDVAIAYAQVLAIVLMESVAGDATAIGVVDEAEDVLADCYSGSVSKSFLSSCEECAKTRLYVPSKAFQWYFNPTQ